MRTLLRSALLLVLASGLPAQEPLKAPPTRKLDVVDTYFGTNIPDPYRWRKDRRPRNSLKALVNGCLVVMGT